MHRIFRHVLIGMAVLISSTADAQTVSQSWVGQQYVGTSNNGPLMAKDNSGNIYVGTYSYQPGSVSGPYYVWKYNSSGVLQWNTSYSLPGSSLGVLYAMTVDASSNVILTGMWKVYDSLHIEHYFLVTVKFNSSGTRLWAVQTNIAKYYNLVSAITTDAAGNIYLAGSTKISALYPDDYFTLKLDANGVLQWSASYDGPPGGYDVPTAIAVDASGNVYTTGYSEGKITSGGLHSTTIYTGYDYLTIKYSPTGQALWTSRYSSAKANYADVATGLVLDASGNVYVTGSANGVGTTVAYSSDGSTLWVAQGPNQINTAIVKDASGNIIVAGYNTTGEGYPLTYYAIKYTPAGAVSWTRSYQGGPNYASYFSSPCPLLAVDAQSNVYMAGAVLAAGSTGYRGYNFFTMKLSSTGGFIWSTIYNGPTNNGDVPTAMVLYQKSSVTGINYPSVYVAGVTDYSGSYSYSTVVKYTQSAVAGTSVSQAGAIQSNVLTGGDGGLVLSNWPNPYKGTTNISYTLPFDGHVILQVYDMAGKLVATPVNKQELAGLHTLPFHGGAAGVYSYRIVAKSDKGSFTDTKQMMVQ